MENNSPPGDNRPALFDKMQYLSPNEVATRLGISRDYFYVLAKRKNIPKIQVGERSVRYKWEEVIAALTQRRDSDGF